MNETELIDLAIIYFRRQGFEIQRDVICSGFSGLLLPFDLLIEKNDKQQPVWIKDWNRTLGVNIVINLDKASVDAGFTDPILVAGKFSDHAKAYANRRRVILITENEIKRKLI